LVYCIAFVLCDWLDWITSLVFSFTTLNLKPLK